MCSWMQSCAQKFLNVSVIISRRRKDMKQKWIGWLCTGFKYFMIVNRIGCKLSINKGIENLQILRSGKLNIATL